jgi:superfamily II DNA or RNA helicase
LDINDPVIKKLPKPSVVSYPTPKKVEITMNREPRSPLQEDCIKKMLTSDSPKITLELKPGVGKTFIATYAASKLQLKPLVVAPTTLLKNQWVEEFEGCGIPRDQIATKIWDAPNKKVCVVTISTIELELGKDWEKLMNVINESSFGIKIIDEAHLHLKGMLRLDAICNIKHNWYLSATLGRSDISEDNILNRALLDADRFIGNGEYKEYQKEYVNIYLQDIWYNPSNKLCQEYFKFGKKGLIKATYYRMLLNYKNGIPFMNNMIKLLKIAENLKTYDAKVLLLIPLLDVIDRLYDIMMKDPYFDKYNIVKIDGSMPLRVKRAALDDGDIILSTTLSVGTGVDIKNLACVVNFDQAASSIILEQCFGRLRDRDKECWYIDVCDHVKQARSFTKWGSNRRFLLPYFPGSKPDMKQLPNIYC